MTTGWTKYWKISLKKIYIYPDMKHLSKNTCRCRWMMAATPEIPVTAFALVKCMLITLHEKDF